MNISDLARLARSPILPGSWRLWAGVLYVFVKAPPDLQAELLELLCKRAYREPSVKQLSRSLAMWAKLGPRRQR